MKSIFAVLFLVFFSTATYSFNNNVQIIEFYEPGNYTITPGDYGNSNNIIIEMWGAGSGGSVLSSFNVNNCGEWSCAYDTDFIGGVSGSYIKANIVTHGNTFYFTVGSGGNNGCEAYPGESFDPYYCIGNNGGDTTFTNGADLTLDATGGTLCHNCNPYYVCQAAPIYTNITFGTIVIGVTGTCGSTGVNKYVSGATSVNGLVGDGRTVGHGAYCCGEPLGKGGDGAVVIYYVANYTPSPTISFSSSISTSNTRSATPSVTPRVSFSPTSSVSYDNEMNFDSDDFVVILILGGAIGLVFCFGVCFVIYKKYEKVTK